MTEAVFLAFQAASGDNHPIHYDVGVLQGARHAGPVGARACRRWRRPRLAPDCSPIMTEDSLVGFIEQSSRFLKPVFAGDTVYPALEIDELTANRTTGVVGLQKHGPQPAARTGAGGAAAIPVPQADGVTGEMRLSRRSAARYQPPNHTPIPWTIPMGKNVAEAISNGR